MTTPSSPPLAATPQTADRPAFAAMVNGLPDPVLVVVAHDAEDLSDRRVVFANPAARDLLRIQGEGAPLVSAIRHPRVLEAVDESLFGGLAIESVEGKGSTFVAYFPCLQQNRHTTVA